MLFWLVLHSFQLSDVEASEPGFSGEKWTSSCLIRSTPNAMKIDRGHFYEDSLDITEDGGEGTHQAARRVPGASPLGRAKHPPGCLVALLGAPSRLYYPSEVKTIKEEEFRSFAAASWRKPTEKKKASPAGRFRHGYHLPEGEIIAIVIIIVM